MSTSIDDSASTSADGLACINSGATAVTAPTPAKLTAAMLMKSRRRTPGSPASAGVGSPGIRGWGCSTVAINGSLSSLVGALTGA